MKERSAQIFIPQERKFILVLPTRRMVGGGNLFYLKFWVKLPSWSENADFQPIFARTSSAVTPSEKKVK